MDLNLVVASALELFLTDRPVAPPVPAAAFLRTIAELEADVVLLRGMGSLKRWLLEHGSAEGLHCLELPSLGSQVISKFPVCQVDGLVWIRATLTGGPLKLTTGRLENARDSRADEMRDTLFSTSLAPLRLRVSRSIQPTVVLDEAGFSGLVLQANSSRALGLRAFVGDRAVRANGSSWLCSLFDVPFEMSPSNQAARRSNASREVASTPTIE